MSAGLFLAAAMGVAAWRGEELYVPVPRSVKLGDAPAPIEMKVGSLQAVAYQEKPQNDDWRTAFDRIAWGADVGGPRVVSIRVPATAKAGKYALGELELRVVDRVLPPPAQWKFHLDLWQHPWAVARWHGVKPFSKEHFEKMLPLWKLLGSCGQKVITATIVPQPWNHQCYDGYGSMVGVKEKANGTFEYDFTDFDRYVTFCRKCGVGPRIVCWSMAKWGLWVSWTGPDGKEKGTHLIPGKEKFDWYWRSFLKAFVAHLKAKGWFADTYMGLDERIPEEMKAVCDYVKKHGEGLKIHACGNRKPSEYEGMEIDDFCLSIQFVDEKYRAEAAARAKAGKTTTTYVCSGPYTPNTFLCSDPTEAHWLAVYQHVAGFSGLLRWAYNSWPENPMCDGSNGHWWSGDTFLVYPDGSPSARLLMLRNGIQSVEKWRILAADKRHAARLAAVAARYDLKAAFSASHADYRKLYRETTDALNAE